MIGYYLQSSQVNAVTQQLTNRLPTFAELVQYYGPYLGLVPGLVIAFMVMQYVWFTKNLRDRKEELKRVVDKEEQLYKRILHLIDK